MTEKQCKTDYVQECNNVTERQCRTDFVQECNAVTEQVCNTVQVILINLNYYLIMEVSPFFYEGYQNFGLFVFNKDFAQSS